MSSHAPWKDRRWLPGVLNKAQMSLLIDANLIVVSDPEKIKEKIDWDASALDLHLSSVGYEMIQGSIKPFDGNYGQIVADSFYATKMDTDIDGAFLLKTNHCYVFLISESINPCIKDAPIYGQATAKSTVGRVDVIARLIVDGMREYEKFNPKEVSSSGKMFLEITPITFDVKVKEGISISQLRFFYGEIENSIINDLKFINSILNINDGSINNGTLSVDVTKVKLKSKEVVGASAFRAIEKVSTPIELWSKDKYSQEEFWIPVELTDRGEMRSVIIKPNSFYILRSKERISLNEGVCVYCRAMDETLGEMRIHYAGFVHPCFGEERIDGKPGTPLIFEVRGHNVQILLTHGEILARLFFYRMSENVVKEVKIESYTDQELKLSTLFKKNWD